MISSGPPHSVPFDLAASARGEMVREGFHLGEPADAQQQIEEIREQLAARNPAAAPARKDLTTLLWSSIDNDTSRDLDQAEYAEETPAGIRILVAIADVASAVLKDSPLDQFAAAQTQTVYTAAQNFPMLPFELSTALTSLNQGQPRAAILCDYTVDPAGTITAPAIYAALIRNQAQLAYSTAGPFLDGTPRPDGRYDPQLAANPALAAQLRLQDSAAQRLKAARSAAGALDFNRVEADPVVIDGKVQSLQAVGDNRASTLIAELMIAANETMAITLRQSRRSCLRRVVRAPERWARIVALAAGKGTQLPAQPDSRALNLFLQSQHTSDPDHYPDLALAIIKLMGPGEYVLSTPQDPDPPGHFGLAARDYTHSTAPNRRFADLVTQRIVLAMLAHQPAPYADAELATIAEHLNQRDSAARKVERTMQKRVAAVALGSHIGQQYRGVITGASPKVTFIRIFDPPVEGMVVQGAQSLDVGDTASVTLSHTDPTHAFIDFTRP